MPATRERDANGRFARQLSLWVPEHWNEGYVDSKGRFRVYRPDYPRAYGVGLPFERMLCGGCEQELFIRQRRTCIM